MVWLWACNHKILFPKTFVTWTVPYPFKRSINQPGINKHSVQMDFLPKKKKKMLNFFWSSSVWATFVGHCGNNHCVLSSISTFIFRPGHLQGKCASSRSAPRSSQDRRWRKDQLWHGLIQALICSSRFLPGMTRDGCCYFLPCGYWRGGGKRLSLLRCRKGNVWLFSDVHAFSWFLVRFVYHTPLVLSSCAKRSHWVWLWDDIEGRETGIGRYVLKLLSGMV